MLISNPRVLSTLRMTTSPPLVKDRLVGLAGVPRNLVDQMEKKNRVPPRMPHNRLTEYLEKISQTIGSLVDRDVFVWMDHGKVPTELQLSRASTIVADRLCNTLANPIIRNAQERRQLAVIGKWLIDRKYKNVPTGERVSHDELPRGSYAFRLNVSVAQTGNSQVLNLPVDIVVMPRSALSDETPLLIEAKSAGDFANVNKRRKEEAAKVAQLRNTYGASIRYALFLCGYFDTGYLEYEAAEGIDWVWEHRVDDLAEFGL